MTPGGRDAIRRAARPLEGGPRDYDALIERAWHADVVLLGEASHGTHEFYLSARGFARFPAWMWRNADVLDVVGWLRAWPATDRMSHDFEARLRQQFDAVIHIDDTRAVEPPETTATWEHGELPETYPHAV